MRRLEVLQWFGLLAGAAMWGAAHVVGFGISEADCSAGGSGWKIGIDLWEGVLTGVAGALVIGAGLAAWAVVLRTRETSYEAEPPLGRMRFFAIAALVANLLFLVMIALYAAGTIVNVPCRQA
jgi:hypothetical protein